MFKIELGTRVRDRLSGFEGIAIVRSEYLYGCIRYAVQPQQLHEGKPIDAHYFDEGQLEVLPSEPEKSSSPSPGGDRPNPRRAPDPRR